MFLPILAAGILVYGIFVHPLVTYFYDPKKLRQYPAPSIAGFTSFWRIWHNLKHNHYLVVHEAHLKLGSHVRIGLNHISVSDPAAWKDIYGHGNSMQKDGWYDAGAGEFRHMSDARDKMIHQRKRRLLAHVFAQATIVDLEPFVVETTEHLLERMSAFSAKGHDFNFRRYINYFTLDLFGRLLFSKSPGCIAQGSDLMEAETPSGKVYKAPFIRSLHNAMRISTILGFEPKLLPITKPFFGWWHPWKKAGVDFDNIIHRMIMQRRREPPENANDIFSKFLKNNKGEDLDLPAGEILSEASVLMNAGTDTTSAAMTNVIYLLCKHPTAARKLQAELDEAMGGTVIPNYEQVAKLPYLRAVIEETLRLRPSIAIGLPREVPSGGRMIAGKWVEEGVTVSAPQYTLFRHPDYFTDCNEFKPERWLECDTTLMNQAYMPFSTGPRACIGRNISYFEMLLVISAIVKKFDFSLVDPTLELKVMERFNANPDELFVYAKERATKV